MKSLIKQLVDKLIDNPTLAKIEKELLDRYEAAVKKPVVEKKGEDKVTSIKV